MSVAFIRANERLTNRDGGEIGGRILYGGIRADNDYIINRSFAQHVGNDFHVFSLTWTESNIRLAVDDNVYGEIPVGAASDEEVR